VPIALQNWLNTNYVFSPPAAIPYEYLPAQSYYIFTVELCNFLGYCSIGSTTVIVLDSVLPSVSILGEKTRTVYRYNTLSLSGNAYTPACGTGSPTTKNLQYYWSIADSSTGLTIDTIKSDSKDPAVFM